MQENPARYKGEADDIDLIRVFLSMLGFIRKNRLALLAFNLAGLAIAAVYYYSAERIYSSRFTGECMLLPDGRTIELLKDLDGLRKNEDWVLLGQRLMMKPEEVKKIKEILPLPNATIDKESRGTEDYAAQYNPMPFSFSVVVKVTDNSILPQFQKGMVQYLSENPYNSIRVSRFIENRKNLLVSINAEIARLDSLFFQDKIIRYKSVSKPETNNEITYKDLLFELHEKKENIEDELRFALPVRIIQEFTAFRKPIFPIKWQVGLFALVISNALALMVLGLNHLRRNYSNAAD